MHHLSVLTVVICFAWISLVASTITVRIRLSSGFMERIQVNEDEDTFSSIRDILHSKGYILQKDSLIKYKEKSISEYSTQTVLKEVGVHPGDIFDIKESIISANTGGVVGTNPNPVQNLDASRILLAKQKTKKGPSSIADINKSKSQLVKIARQKTAPGSSVQVPAQIGTSCFFTIFVVVPLRNVL